MCSAYLLNENIVHTYRKNQISLHIEYRMVTGVHVFVTLRTNKSETEHEIELQEVAGPYARTVKAKGETMMTP